VLMVTNGEAVNIGAPHVAGAWPGRDCQPRPRPPRHHLQEAPPQALSPATATARTLPR
jgi:hypothetical protein